MRSARSPGGREQALQAFERFHELHTEPSALAWELWQRRARVDLHLHELAAAAEAYAALASERFGGALFAQVELGYLEGLRAGGSASAAKRLCTAALESQQDLSTPEGLRAWIYQLLWLWILAEEDADRTTAADTLQDLMAGGNVAEPWDRAILAFLLEASDADLPALAEEEARRRMQADLPLDDLACEAWFYAGLRRERDAREERAPAARDAGLARALAAYARAVEQVPFDFKWEWEYARLGLARLAGELSLPASAEFRLAESAVASVVPGSAAWKRGLRRGPATVRVHRAGAAGPLDLEPGEAYAPVVGDLLQCVLGEGRERRRVDVVVGVAAE